MTVAAIIAIIQADKVLKRLREKILSNRGTFRDTFEYSNRAAELLGATFSESVLAMSLDDRVSACVELLRDRYDDIMPLLDAVQKRADLKNKLTIAPKHPPFNTERAEQIGTSLRDLSVPDERIQRRARSAPETATRAIHDDYIEANVELRSAAGIKCYITRTTDGNCCDWCTRVAGRYEYGTEPDDIFRRHDNCGCSVTYENGRERQDVWSKKTWTVSEDAGAPEPTRFTREQAAAAGAEPPRVFSMEEARNLNDVKAKENTANPRDVHNSSIDISENSGIMESEIGDFKKKLKSDSNISDKYYTVVKERFVKCPRYAREVYNRYVPANSVADCFYKGTPCFDRDGVQRVFMNFLSDEDNPKGNGGTWFHEHAHMIDHFAGYISHNPDYIDALKKDFENIVKRKAGDIEFAGYSEAVELIRNNSQVASKIKEEIMDYRTQHGVSDIIHGLSKSLISGCASHPDPRYWNDNTICEEAFAHMFESLSDESGNSEIIKFFPNSRAVFINILKEAAK